MLSNQQAKHEDSHCWYVEMQEWLEADDININALPPFQYSLDCPHLNMTTVKKY